MRKKASILVRDTISSALFVGPSQALIPLSNFIASNRLDASDVWLGIMVTGVYMGALWNLFFSRVSARVSLGKSIVVLMCAAAGLVLAAGFQTSAVPYCLLILFFLFFVGMYNIQYMTIIPYLHPADSRHRRLSYRYTAISIMIAGLTLLFGYLSVKNYRSISVISAVMILVAAFVFNTMRREEEHYMRPFKTRDVFTTLIGDPNLRRVAILLIIHGAVGAGFNAPLSVLYKRLGFAEDTVGMLSAVRTVATVIAAATITPRLRFPGGLRNFRFALTVALASLLVFLFVAATPEVEGPVWYLLVANALYGLSISAFAIGAQTNALQLAPEGKTTLYVNAQTILMGARGVVWPLLVGVFLQTAGLLPTFVLSAGAVLSCAVLTWTPLSRLKQL